MLEARVAAPSLIKSAALQNLKSESPFLCKKRSVASLSPLLNIRCTLFDMGIMSRVKILTPNEVRSKSRALHFRQLSSSENHWQTRASIFIQILSPAIQALCSSVIEQNLAAFVSSYFRHNLNLRNLFRKKPGSVIFATLYNNTAWKRNNRCPSNENTSIDRITSTPSRPSPIPYSADRTKLRFFASTAWRSITSEIYWALQHPGDGRHEDVTALQAHSNSLTAKILIK